MFGRRPCGTAHCPRDFMVTPAPQLVRAPKISIVWVVPLVALLVALWMLVREWHNHGKEIAIEFADGSSLEPGQTKLEYRGVIVGKVKEVDLTDDLGGVVVRVQLMRNAEAIARKGAMFWIVQPEIGFSGVSSLDTLLSGVHLGVRPGSGAPATDFRGLDAPPAPEKTDEGRAFVLQTDQLGGLQVHAPVLYRDVKVGEVEAVRLNDDATGVSIRVRVQNPYIGLVRTGTCFWNVGGAPLQISLFGGSNQKRSLQSIITGAVAFATPEEPGEVAADGTKFPLHKNPDNEWLKWRPRISITAPETAPEKPPQPNVVPGIPTGG